MCSFGFHGVAEAARNERASTRPDRGSCRRDGGPLVSICGIAVSGRRTRRLYGVHAVPESVVAADGGAARRMPPYRGSVSESATEVTTIVYPLTRSGPSGGPDWSGTHLLAPGLDASLRDSGPWVEIEQPNDRTLVIRTPVWLNETEQEVKRVLDRSRGDFGCAEGTLSISMRTKSAAEAAGLSEGWTALGLLLGSAEIHAERHLFTRAQNGDLVMEVQQTRWASTGLLFPMATPTRSTCAGRPIGRPTRYVLALGRPARRCQPDLGRLVRKSLLGSLADRARSGVSRSGSSPLLADSRWRSGAPSLSSPRISAIETKIQGCCCHSHGQPFRVSAIPRL